MPIKSGPEWGDCPCVMPREGRHTANAGGAQSGAARRVYFRRLPSHPLSRMMTKGPDLEPLEQILRAGDVGLAGRILDVERLHHAVVDHHGVALRACAEAAFAEIDRQADRLREGRAPVCEKLDLAG